jgi:uncharacterized glyoxalase superfamily protein PhnB
MTQQVKPVPDAYHTLTPRLAVSNADQAIDFYKRAFGAEEQGRMHGPDGQTVVHAALRIGSSMLHLNDDVPALGNRSPPALGGTSVGLHLYVEDADAAFQRAVSAGAEVKMPPSDMYWGNRVGIVVDPFGHLWAIASQKENLTYEEVARRAQTANRKGH